MNGTDTPRVVRRGPVLLKVMLRLAVVVPVMLALMFVPAGTLDYWQAKLFCATLFTPMLLVLVYLLAKDPALLDRRMRVREKDRRQSVFVKISFVVFVSALVTAGLDVRWQWSQVPTTIVLVADVVMLCGYALFIVVLRANTHASRVIEVERGQKVITTGPYAVVRHPMYVAVIVMYLVMPLVLGSYWGLLPMAPLPVLLAYRIVNEERVLREQLPGYIEYTHSVRYRMVPYLW